MRANRARDWIVADERLISNSRNGSRQSIYNDVPSKALTWCIRKELEWGARRIVERIEQIIGRQLKENTCNRWITTSMSLQKNAAAWDNLRGKRITSFVPQVAIDAVIVWYCEAFPSLNAAALHSKITRRFWEVFCGEWEIEVMLRILRADAFNCACTLSFQEARGNLRMFRSFV